MPGLDGMARGAMLFHVVGTLRFASRFAGHIDRRQQQHDQNADDGDDHQQFNEREALRREPGWDAEMVCLPFMMGRSS